jgi:hypothetical protein
VVGSHAAAVEPAGVVLYPFWDVEALVHVKAPLLPAVTRRWRVAVDGVTGAPAVLQPDLEVVDGGPTDLAPRDPLVVGFALQAEDLNQPALQRLLWQYASRRLRSWMNVRVELGTARPVYKELRLFSVTFRNGSTALLALDTISGEYGVVPQYGPGLLPQATAERGGARAP